MPIYSFGKAPSLGRTEPKLTFVGARSKVPTVKQMMRVMKLTAIVIMAACLQVSAAGYSQKITLSVKDAPAEQVFASIQKQSGYFFMYKYSLLKEAKPITIKVTEVSLEETLALILKDQPFTYKVVDQLIVLKEKSAEKEQDNVTRKDLIDVKGRVVNAKGEPVSGASITVQGSKKSVITDGNGEFNLSEINENAVINISHVQYETTSISLYGKSIINITLHIKVSSLDELQVIAYGTTTKRLNTGNVSTIKASDIEMQPVNNPLLALQGRVPGITITQSTGFAGSGVAVQIQGQNTFRPDIGNDPLYVIDGVPYPSRLLFSLGRVQGSSGGNAPNVAGSTPGDGSPLSFINPSDIESIDILKDADATAIYGSRAAAGAIVVTTKKGKAGLTKVDINLQNGWGKMTRRLDLLNSQQYLEMRQEAFRNDNSAPSLNGLGDYDLLFWDTTRYTDWQKILLGGTAHYNDIQTSVSGGNLSTQFLVSAGYHRETTVFPGNFSDQRGSLHFNINNTSPNQKFRLQFTGSYMFDNNELFQRDLTQDAIRIAPVAPSIYNEDGSLNWAPLPNGSSTWTNPIAYLNQEFNNKTNNIVGNTVISYRLFSGLEVKSSFGYTNLQSNQILTKPWSSIRPESRQTTQRSTNFFNNNINSWIVEPQVIYKQGIWKGKLDVLVGMTIHQNNSRWINISGSGYSSDLVMESIAAAATRSAIDGSAQYKYNAVFGRLNYNWGERYIININARRDGSSRFGLENRFHNFGSIAGAWIFSNEKFFEKTQRFVSFGKLRASYGTTGNDQIGDYKFLNQYNLVSGNVPYQGVSGSIPASLPNPYLAWEQTRKLQFGLDIGVLRDRILLSANYYRNRSSNQLVPYDLPIMTGFPSITRNFPALIQNYGWELVLNTSNLNKIDFNWSSSINLTIPRNELLKFPNLEKSSYANSLVIGKPITVGKVYPYLGVNPTTGAYQFADKNGNAVSSPVYPDDYTVLIDLAPKFYGGFQNSFRYKGFELDILFQFVKQMGGNYKFGNLPGLAYDLSGNQPATVLNRWQKSGDDKPTQRYFSSFFNTSLYDAAIYANSSDAGISDASFIRLKNLSLSWRLPEKWMNKKYIENARIYMHGQNLMTITNYNGLDPETKNVLRLPPLKVITVGVQVTF